MVQRDYILRIIEQLGAAVIALRKAIMGGSADSSDVEDTLRRAASAAGMDLDLARAMDVDALPAVIAPSGEVEPARAWMLAEIFLTEAIRQKENGESEQARSSLAKAGVLFKLVGPGGAYLTGFREAEERLAEIEALLEGLDDHQDPHHSPE